MLVDHRTINAIKEPLFVRGKVLKRQMNCMDIFPLIIAPFLLLVHKGAMMTTNNIRTCE